MIIAEQLTDQLIFRRFGNRDKAKLVGNGRYLRAHRRTNEKETWSGFNSGQSG